LRTIEEVEKEMNIVMDTLEKLQKAMTILIYERMSLVAIQKDLEASSEILTEKLIERIKQ